MKPDFGFYLASRTRTGRHAFEPMMPSISPTERGCHISFVTVAGQEMFCGTIDVPSHPLDALIELTRNKAFFLGSPSDLVGTGASGEEFRLIAGTVSPLSSLPGNGHLLTMLRKQMRNEDRSRRGMPALALYDLVPTADLSEMVDVGEQSSADVVSIHGHLALETGEHVYALSVLHEEMEHFALLKSTTEPIEAQSIFSRGNAVVDFVGTPSIHFVAATREEHGILLGAFRSC